MMKVSIIEIKIKQLNIFRSKLSIFENKNPSKYLLNEINTDRMHCITIQKAKMIEDILMFLKFDEILALFARIPLILVSRNQISKKFCIMLNSSVFHFDAF